MDISEILEKHLSFQGKSDDKWWLQSSVKHYLETGKISGSFYKALHDAMDEYAFQEKHLFQIKKRMNELEDGS